MQLLQGAPSANCSRERANHSFDQSGSEFISNSPSKVDVQHSRTRPGRSYKPMPNIVSGPGGKPQVQKNRRLYQKKRQVKKNTPM